MSEGGTGKIEVTSTQSDKAISRPTTDFSRLTEDDRFSLDRHEQQAGPTYKTLGDIPGIRPGGINEGSTFKPGGMNSDDAIDSVTHINGIPVERLEWRMEPHGGTTIYSSQGFLGKDDTLLGIFVFWFYNWRA
jgi:hypothetical protein